MSHKPAQKYVSYIQTDHATLWQALTEPKFTEQYFFGTKVESDFEVGSKISYIMEDGNAAIIGEILEISPKDMIKFSFSHRFDGEMSEVNSEVTYLLEPSEDAMMLTILHDNFTDDGKTYDSVAGGWPKVISGLKTYLETGKALKI